MKFIKMSGEGNYRGQDYKPDTILSVGESLFNSMILGGKGSPSIEEAYKAQNGGGLKPYSEMTLTELKEVEYTKLNLEPLRDYAKACGVEDVSGTKKEIKVLLEKVDFEAGK